MAQYFFKVPVIVKYRDDDDELRLTSTREEVSAFVAEDMMNNDLPQYFYRTKAKSLSLTAAPDGDSVRVVITAAGRYSNKTAKLLLDDLEGQCSDGWGENGWELFGFDYGYGYNRIYVSPWEHDKRVTIMTPEEAKVGIIEKVESKAAAQSIVISLSSSIDMAKEFLPSSGHDDREALLVILEKALTTAKNVLG